MGSPTTEAGRRMLAAINGGGLALWSFDEEGQAYIADAVAQVEEAAARDALDRVRAAVEALPDPLDDRSDDWPKTYLLRSAVLAILEPNIEDTRLSLGEGGRTEHPENARTIHSSTGDDLDTGHTDFATVQPARPFLDSGEVDMEGGSTLSRTGGVE